ncbi:MAG: polysaccharide biosynthesis protein [Bacteroidota bacterium]
MNNLKKLILSFSKKLSKNYVPRWLIFLIDCFIAFSASQFAFILVSTIESSNPLKLINLSPELWALFGIQVFYFFIFRSYSGIVRYTGFKDAFRQLQTTISTVVTVLVINHIIFYFLGRKIIVDAGVIVYGFIAFSSLYFFRIIVKRIYQVIQANSNSTNAFILGTGLTDVAIAESILSDTQRKFNIVGFISENEKPPKTRIFTLPVLCVSDLVNSSKKAKAVIVSAQKLQDIIKSESKLISDLLENNFKIYKLPEIEDWDKPISSGIKEVNLEDLLQRSPIRLNRSKLRGTYESRIILVTGAGGSIGSDIVRQLTAYHPKKIILLDQAETPLHEISVFLDKNHPEIDFEKVIADVTNYRRLEAIFNFFEPEIVFHGAAYKHVPMMEANPIESLSVNFYGTKNLTDLSIKFNIKRFVFISTDKAVNPTNIMGATKRSAEIYIQSKSRDPLTKTTFMTTRFGNVLGSNGSVIPHFKKQIEEGGPVTVTDPKITRYFMTIDEACQLVLEAGAMGKGGEIYVFDMGKPVKIIDLAHKMIRLSGFTPNEDIQVNYTGLRPGEKLYEELLADEENTQPTHHQKILIAKSTFEFNKENNSYIEELNKAIADCDIEKSVAIMKLLVPEYKPFQANPKMKKA